MRKILALLALLLAASPAHAQYMYGTQAPGTAPQVLNNFPAKLYGGCTWDAAHDVGSCINAAIAAAAAAGGGAVIVPAGTFGWSTAIVNNTSGVQLLGAGIGIPRDTIDPTKFLAATRLVWIGGATAGPALDIEPSGTQFLYAAGVSGIAFDCASLVDTCITIKQVTASIFRLGQAEARKTGIQFTTNNVDGAGDQQNDVWLWARNVSASFNPTGILLDSGAGASFNTSYNTKFYLLSSAYAGGDGIVMGNSDTNLIGLVTAFHFGSATTGSPFVCANSAYTPPSGVAVNGQCYDNVFDLAGVPMQFGGGTQGSVWTEGGGNLGTAHLNPVTISTNATTAGGSAVLNFASTTGIVAGESINCGGATSGVYPYTQVNSVTSTTVTMRRPAVIGGGIGSVASGLSCTFSYSMNAFGAPGTYTITATGATTFSITAPAGGHTQGSVSYSGGVANFNDLTVPFTGTPTNGDTWTLVVPTPATKNRVSFVDKANSISDPNFSPMATGFYATATNPGGVVVGVNGITITADQGTNQIANSNTAGPGTVSIGGQCLAPSATDGACISGSGNILSGFFGMVTGQNNTVSSAGFAFGQNNTSSTTSGGGFAYGQQATDRGRYNTQAWAGGDFASQGDAQYGKFILRGTGATGSAFRLTADAASAGSANCVNIPNNSGFALVVTIMAFDHTTVTKNETWLKWGMLLTRGANAASTALVAETTPTPLTNGTLTGSAIAATADTTNGCLNISFTPPTSNTDTWNVVATVDSVEVQ